MAKPAVSVRALAIVGARIRYEQLQQEIDKLTRTFPELSKNAPAPPRKRRRTMSKAARRAVSQRMRAYWAARKK